VRILYVSHGHPEFAAGGAEIASYELFRRVVQLGYDAFYLARVGPFTHPRRPGTPFQAVPGAGHREILFFSEHFDYFTHSQKEHALITVYFREFLEALRPDVVHFSHTLHIGLEAVRQVQNVLPDAVIVYTLHEFLAICAADGQMVRTRHHELCDHASPVRCNWCLPDRTPQDFFLRELFFKSHLHCVDAFVAPSRFLLDRYRAWGLPEHRLHLIENGRASQEEAPIRNVKPGEARGQIGYFGQMTPYKGIEVLLSAMRILAGKGGDDIHLFLHGANFDLQTAEFQAAIRELLAACTGNVTVLPQYSQEDLPGLMENVDWVVVPSTWWENSPLTIQEGFMHRRPVICSNIGGMAEKVHDGVDGLHFTVGDPRSLADTLLRGAQEEGLWARLRGAIRPVFPVDLAAQAHAQLYRSLLERRPAPESCLVCSQ
jgi:glycosyltransferase involved in cell wall biosynthesis